MALTDILQKIFNSSKPQPQSQPQNRRVGTFVMLSVLGLLVGYTVYSELFAPRYQKPVVEKGIVYANTAPVTIQPPKEEPLAEPTPPKVQKPQAETRPEPRRERAVPPRPAAETLAQKCRKMARLHSQYSGPYAQAWKVSDCLAEGPKVEQAASHPGQVLEIPSQTAGKDGELQSHPRCTLLRGAVIPVILQDEIQTQTPGQITAVVTQDVRDTATGKCVVVPKGSVVVGHHDTRLADYQTQLPTAWDQLNLPNGLTKSLANYPGADQSGAGGIELDKVDTHFWRRVGSSALLTLSGAAARTALSNTGGGNIDFNEALAAQGGMEMNRNVRQTWGRSGYQGPDGTTYAGKSFALQVTRELSLPGDYYRMNGGGTYAEAD